MRIYYLWIMSVLFFFSAFKDVHAVVPDNVACVFELETQFFTEPIVNQALSLYNIRQELWLPISHALQNKSIEVPERMKRGTARMVPNPIEYPMQRAAVAKILKQVLFEVFMEVMHKYLASDDATAELVFDYIFGMQKPNFIRCFGPEVQRL